MISSGHSSYSGIKYIHYVTPIIFTINIVYGYNMDVRSPIVATGPPGTYFGFSVDIHREGNDDMLIVGAPKGDSNVTGANRTGAVYKCNVEPPFNRQLVCELLTLDTAAGSQINKSEQWLGATVKSSGPDGTVMSCAPFYKVLYNEHHTEISGKCFLQRNNFADKGSIVLCPPEGYTVGFGEGTSCLAGLSGDLTEEGKFVIGAPGGFATQDVPEEFVELVGTIYVQTSRREDFVNPREREYSFDGSIQGYSIAHGRFTARREINYVTGAPRASNQRGQVFIYQLSSTGESSRSNQLDPVITKTGEQIGDNFGQCVAVSDLNADGMDDLVIAAPLYWNRKAQQASVGQIYVYYQDEQFELPDDTRTVITGKVANGRFGFSIAALGDINDDGVNDLAVGAPYEGNGVVYIYHGRRRGRINTEPTQILHPKLFEETFQNFGFTLAGGRDADNNSYVDLLVGDYSSDKVLLVRTKPILRPTFQITFDREGVNITSNDTIVGFEVEVCMGYEGRGTPESYNFTIQLTIDAEKQISRAWLHHRGELKREIILPDVVIMKKDPRCENFSVTLRQYFPDKKTPIVVKVSASQLENEDNLSPGEIAPVVDSSRRSSQEQIRIFYSCFNEGCTTDLVLNVQSDKTTLYMGDSSSLTLTVTVENIADDAFAAQLYGNVHTSLQFASHHTIESELVVICEDLFTGMVVCDIGNPLPRQTRLKFNMTFDIPTVPGDNDTLSINLHVNSTTTEEEHKNIDNHDVININLEPKIDVILNGSTNLAQVVYSSTVKDQENISSVTEAGEEIIHTYSIDTQGPGTIQNATLEVKWPMKTEDGDYLLYLTNVSLSSGETCHVTGTEINPLGLKIPKSATKNTDEGRERENDASGPDATLSRNKREEPIDDEIEAEEEVPSPLTQSDTDSITANCSQNYKGCVKIICNIMDVPKDSKNIVLTIRSRLWSLTLPKDYITSWDIVSSATLTIYRLPYVTQPQEGLEKTTMLTLSTISKTLTENRTAPLWSIILSVVVGLVVLLLITVLLWKVGFFKRKKLDRNLILEDQEQDDQIQEELKEIPQGE